MCVCVCVCVCVCEGHSLNKVKFALGVVSRNHYLQIHLFSRKLIVLGCFLTQKTVSMIFFTDGWDPYLFFTGESVCFGVMICLFDSGLSWHTYRSIIC